MYVARTISIDKILTREEIVNKLLDKPEHRVKRFLSLYKLTPNEIKVYREKFKNNRNIQNTISYYQEGDLEVYNRVVKQKRITRC